MNTIKFAPYNELITEQHNIETAQVVKHTINGIERSFYEPCNFNVFVTNACQNSCFFCINKNCKEKCDDAHYFVGLRNSLDLLKDVNLEYTITGGEPTLNPLRFKKTLEILKEYGIKERTISTTGINLQGTKDFCLMQSLLENNAIHNISISRMAFDEDLNNKIFGCPNITNKQLSDLAYFAKMNDMELRVSTNLMEQSISSFDKIIDFVDDSYSICVDTVLFRELVGIDNAIKVAPIFNIIKNDERFEYNTTLTGQFYDVIVYIYTSRKTNKKYIVKCYQGKPGDKNVINSLSYNSGKLTIGFNCEIIKEF